MHAPPGRFARPSILDVDGTLRVPLTSALLRDVQARLDEGERHILLNVSRLSFIDAAGVGELVSAFNAARAAGGMLRITHASRRVRQLLCRVGLSQMLAADPCPDARSAGTSPSAQKDAPR